MCVACIPKPCELCGKDLDFEFMADGEIWETVTGYRHGRGYLCLPCFVTKARQAFKDKSLHNDSFHMILYFTWKDKED